MSEKKPIKLIVDEKDVQEQYDSMKVVFPSKMKKGLEIISKIEAYSYNNCRQTELLVEIVEDLSRKVVVPEDDYVSLKHSKEGLERIKALIENLYQTFYEMILGEPAVFGEKTEYDKGYSKGYYDAKEHLQKLVEELRKMVMEE